MPTMPMHFCGGVPPGKGHLQEINGGAFRCAAFPARSVYLVASSGRRGKAGAGLGGCCRGVQGVQRGPGDQQETGAALTEREEQIIASLAELAGADTGAVGQ